jgi:hypothetical protein
MNWLRKNHKNLLDELNKKLNANREKIMEDKE